MIVNDIAFDELAYRRALGGFGTGVVLIAAHDALGRAHGVIVNSLTSVSLAPPVILWCLGGGCAAFEVFTSCRSFSVNILGAGDEALARQFSRRGERLLPADRLTEMETGAPVLSGALASLDCRMRSRAPVGDHEVIYGDVAAFRAMGAGDALGYFRGGYVTLASGA